MSSNMLKFVKLSLKYMHDNNVYTLETDQNITENTTLRAEVLQIPHQRFQVKILAKKTIKLIQCAAIMNYEFHPSATVFCNGYQSWTESREYLLHETIPSIPQYLKPFWHKHKIKSYGDYNFVTYPEIPGCFHSFTYSYIRERPTQSIITFLGSVNEMPGFTIFFIDTPQNIVRIEREVSELCLNAEQEWLALDIFYTTDEESKAFAEWFSHYQSSLPTVKPIASPTTGWTSWYYHYTHINESIILHNLKSFRQHKIPIEIFQIDDGWQESVGDWLSVNAKFPKGMKTLADAIHSEGYKAGLWLAPFICEEKSSLKKTHPDWIRTNKQGKPVVAGNNDGWSGPFYALDFENPQVRNYLEEVFHTIFHVWNFDMVKLDFLYAVCLEPYSHKTRGQIMCEAMDWLRKVAGEKIILGCGVPLGAAMGRVDYCRIGPDVGLQWEEPEPARINYRERISTITAIINTLSRRHLNGLAFGNDPDVFILRQEANSLTPEQRYSLFLANILFGNVLFTSDDLSKYHDSYFQMPLGTLKKLYPFPKERNILSVIFHHDIYKWKNRPTPQKVFLGHKPYETVVSARVQIENRTYLAVFNLGAQEISFELPENSMYFNGSQFVTKQLKLRAYESCLLYALKQNYSQLKNNICQPEILWSEHIFGGYQAELLIHADNTCEIQSLVPCKVLLPESYKLTPNSQELHSVYYIKDIITK